MLHVESSGRGADVVVLHGTPQDLASFHDVEVGARVHVVHAPGYGSSPHEPPIDDLDGVARAIVDALASRGLRAPILVGCSAGAYRALGLCLDRKIAPRALGLVGGFAGLEAAHRDGLRDAARSIEEGGDLEALISATQFTPAFRGSSPAVVARYVERTLAACPAERVARDLRAFAASPDRTPHLRPLPFPVELLVGADDIATPVAYTEALAAGLATGARVEPGLGHVVHVERPDLWRAWVERLVERAERG